MLHLFLSIETEHHGGIEEEENHCGIMIHNLLLCSVVCYGSFQINSLLFLPTKELRVERRRERERSEEEK
jgi:hypothetical protein